MDKRRLGDKLIDVFKYLKEGCNEDRAKLFSAVPMPGQDTLRTKWKTGGPSERGSTSVLCGISALAQVPGGCGGLLFRDHQKLGTLLRLALLGHIDPEDPAHIDHTVICDNTEIKTDLNMRLNCKT